MKRIHDSLTDLFRRHRLIFWYDDAKEWESAFDSFEADGVEKLRNGGNEFGIKVHVLAESPKDGKFLIYSPTARPDDGENWLLDLVLQGHEFKADRASLAVQELGVSYDFRGLAEQHVGFFRKGENTRRLKELIESDDEIQDIRVKMMAVLAGTTVEIDGMLLKFLDAAAAEPLLDPVVECLGPAELVTAFWRDVGRLFGYAPQEPGMRDFVVEMFRGANPLDDGVPLHPHAQVFLQRWKDSKSHRESFKTWSALMERELHIKDRLSGIENPARLGKSDAFEVFERFAVHRICAAFQRGERASDLRQWIAARRQSFWHEAHRHGYEALAQAIELRELLEVAELGMESLETGFRRYTKTWWRIDTAYRRFCYHQRKYGQVNVMEAVVDWVEGSYLNNFLLPLADRWSDLVVGMPSWEVGSVPAQRSFYPETVKAVTGKGQKALVIVSDALRFEAAADFAERLKSENRWTTGIEAMLASLPSYTQLGMASLLPGGGYAISVSDATVSVDGRSATGLEGRKDILGRANEGRATAVQAEHFLEMNSKTEGRPLMKDHDVVYVFHNVIDKIGDQSTTEAKTSEAVEQCFEELEQIVKKAAACNWNKMILTADHGFLFQQNQLHEGDAAAFPNAEEWLNKNRRFAIGKGISASPAVKVFAADALGLEGDWQVAFPRSLGRFPRQGSGKRFVHGGFSLQEVVVPVVKIHKARSDDTRRVEVEFMRVPAKVTTGQLSLSIYQEEPVSAKVLARQLKLGIYAKDGTVLSEVKTIICDAVSEEPRDRETTQIVVLSSAADSYNDQTVEVRLEETLPGTRQTVTYRSQTIKIQKPFTSDFDDF